MSSDADFSPMLYDVMREMATRVSGRYVSWMWDAEDANAREHWRAEHFRVMLEAREVNPDSRQAIESHMEKLRAELASMPRYAPELP